ncbi:MAG: hypothetical protein AAF518_13685 [Spirochaetota bacterium]
MACFATATVLGNSNLFLWQFLRESTMNRIIFLGLFSKQFLAPVLFTYIFSNNSQSPQKPGIELFIMIAGVITTLSFLLVQAYNSNMV